MTHIMNSRFRLPNAVLLPAVLLPAVLLVWQAPPSDAFEESCVRCHTDTVFDAGDPHGFAGTSCTPCHGGDPRREDKSTAHEGMTARPGEVDNADASCGTCHGEQVVWLKNNPMRTGSRMTQTTRRLLDTDRTYSGTTLDDLGHSPADSLLRKLCASCHLGQPLTENGADPVDDRGGGCLGCHRVASAAAHPVLTRSVGDEKCFGCHSRSGRISLSYAGLAEIEPADGRVDPRRVPRLGDGRFVEHRDADAHHRAGMGCVDCHTGPGLMGAFAGKAPHGVDIACEDCHGNTRPRLRIDQWPPSSRSVLDEIPFDAGPDRAFLTTAQGTPLWHIELRNEGSPLLHRKSDGKPLVVPQIEDRHFLLEEEHNALTCDACHATWAPQCHGCHVRYDPQGFQWDHLLRRYTPGAWHETRWGVINGPPPLGRRADGRVATFVPGMILTLEHPDQDEPRFLRRFSPLAPHTTGKARSCEGCHRDPKAFGLGEGSIENTGSGIHFSPVQRTLADGLAADAWTSLELPDRQYDGPHPFPSEDIRKLLTLPLDGQ